jgi:hypothetical protein
MTGADPITRKRITSASVHTDGYALPAALIGVILAGAIGMCGLGWYRG